MERIKVNTVCNDTLPVIFDTDISQHPPCCTRIQPMSQQMADVTGTDAALFDCNWYVYQIILLVPMRGIVQNF